MSDYKVSERSDSDQIHENHGQGSHDNTQDGDKSAHVVHEKLRTLILGIEQKIKLDELTQDQSSVISEALPVAVSKRNAKDDALANALSPNINKVLQQSIKNNPAQIADTLFPIIGPAIRKAVASSLKDMIQSLNHLLESSLSLRSIGWRYQAWRSGKSYAEYVLLKTLKYRVEQVFFIARESGLLIQSVNTGDQEFEDPDLVSSMLTAINDFVGDSFSDKSNTIEKIEFGALTLHIAVGPLAILAASVRGTTVNKVNRKLTNTIELLHQQHFEALKNFDGDKDHWSHIIPELESCLITQSAESQHSKKPWGALLLLTSIVLYFIYQQANYWSQYQQAKRIVETIQASEQYLVSDWELNDNHLSINLVSQTSLGDFHDFIKSRNLVIEPINLKVNSFELENSFNLYYSKAKSLQLLQMAFINSPEVIVSQQQGKIDIKGSINKHRLDALLKKAEFKNAFEYANSNNLHIQSEVDIQQLEAKYQEAYKTLQSIHVPFARGETTLGIEARPLVQSIVENIKTLQETGPKIGKQLEQILLLGYADTLGAKSNNNRLSLERANYLKSILVSNGVEPSLLFVWGAGEIKGLQVSPDQQRRVGIDVFDTLLPENKLPENKN